MSSFRWAKEDLDNSTDPLGLREDGIYVGEDDISWGEQSYGCFRPSPPQQKRFCREESYATHFIFSYQVFYFRGPFYNENDVEYV